jgi:CubicO group peptidase (beta-lactamase class C family)
MAMEPDKPLPEMLRQRIEAMAAQFVAHPQVPALMVGVNYHGATTLLSYGSVRLGAGAAPDGDTLFEIGSITKVFTTLLLADMVERGEVKLDDPVQQYLPAEGRLPGTVGEEITLRHLATHTSGLPRLPGNLDGPDLNPEDPYAHYQEEALLTFLSRYRPRRRPGQTNEYSNLGMGLLGYLLARRAGKEYEALLAERVLTPLGLRDTGLRLAPEAAARLAPAHAGGKEVRHWDLGVLAGAGGLRSSTRDMLRFLSAQLGQAGGPLQSAIQLTHQVQFGNPFALSTPYYLARLALGISLAGALAFNLLPGAHLLLRLLAMGLGWLVLETCLGGWLDRRLQPIALGWHLSQPGTTQQTVLWHNGGTGGGRSFLGFSREQGVGVVVLTNCDRDVDATGNQILAALLEGSGN